MKLLVISRTSLLPHDRDQWWISLPEGFGLPHSDWACATRADGSVESVPRNQTPDLDEAQVLLARGSDMRVDFTFLEWVGGLVAREPQQTVLLYAHIGRRAATWLAPWEARIPLGSFSNAVGSDFTFSGESLRTPGDPLRAYLEVLRARDEPGIMTATDLLLASLTPL